MEWIERLREFEKSHKKELEEVVNLHADFLRSYPFRECPEEIEALTPEQIYNPGTKQDYFLGWIEFKLKNLGRIFTGSALYAESAREQHEKFKELLRVVVDSSLSIAERIDAHWEDIRGFGGDKLVAKKIIFCYWPEKMLPIFKTEHLEYFARQLGADYTRDAYDLYGKAYGALLSLGQKCEVLNRALLKALGYQDKELGVYETLLLAKFLYEMFPPPKVPLAEKKTEPLHSLGIMFAPEYEQEVLYLFSVLHRDLGFPYVLKIRNEFPDATVIDKQKEVKTIEFELKASDFVQHGHPKSGCDFIVCWENDLEDPGEEMPKIISLKDFVAR